MKGGLVQHVKSQATAHLVTTMGPVTARKVKLLSVTYGKNVKLSLCFNWAPCHEGVLGEWR
jgi:hypothetical protein